MAYPNLCFVTHAKLPRYIVITRVLYHNIISNKQSIKGNKMGKLNIGSERIITVIQCNVKSDPAEFKKWIKDRA